MAKIKLFGNKPEPRCETCSFGKTSAEGDAVMCKHAGVVSPSHSCRRFRYDPLKRVPRRSKPLTSFDEQAFSLDIEEEPTVATVEPSAPTVSEKIDAVAVSPSDDVLIPDDSDDIFADLARLNIEQVKSSTHAALRTFEPQFFDDDDNIGEEALIGGQDSDDTLLTLADDSEEYDDNDTLSADDLIILNHAQLDDENTEMLVIGEDGNIESIPAE